MKTALVTSIFTLFFSVFTVATAAATGGPSNREASALTRAIYLLLFFFKVGPRHQSVLSCNPQVFVFETGTRLIYLQI